MNMGKFVLNVVVAFFAYGALYQGGNMIFADAFDSYMAMDIFVPEEESLMTMLAYHLVQTVVVVWLFNKVVGSGDLKAGAMFGLMIGFYLMATDSVWMTGLKDFPTDTRLAADILNIANGAIVGAMLAFMHGKGWGASLCRP